MALGVGARANDTSPASHPNPKSDMQYDWRDGCGPQRPQAILGTLQRLPYVKALGVEAQISH